MAYTVRIQQTGIDPIKVERAAAATDNVSLRHMEGAMERAMGLITSRASTLSPHRSGRLARSWTSDVRRTGDNVIGTAGSRLDYAEYVERGTGLHRVGPGPKRLIRPRDPDGWLAIPVAELRGPRRTQGRGPVIRARASRGQHPQWVLRRAHVQVAQLITPIFGDAAASAARELRGMM